jgi:integrase
MEVMTVDRQSAPAIDVAGPPRLLDRLAEVPRQRGHSEPTDAQLVAWGRAFVLFHGKRYPRALDLEAVSRFLEHVVRREKEPLSALEMARTALELLYRGVFQLMARLLYGCGLRLQECCQLRVKDMIWDRDQLVVRGGKGDKDRMVMLPRTIRADLERQRDARRGFHDRDLARGVARVELPHALERRYPAAAREFGWQFLFASRQLSRCSRTGRSGRHHVFSGVGPAGGGAGRRQGRIGKAHSLPYVSA